MEESVVSDWSSDNCSCPNRDMQSNRGPQNPNISSRGQPYNGVANSGNAIGNSPMTIDPPPKTYPTEPPPNQAFYYNAATASKCGASRVIVPSRNFKSTNKSATSAHLAANDSVYNIEALDRGTKNDFMAHRKLQGTRKVSTNPFEIANEGVYNIESLNRGTKNDYMAQRKLQGTRKVSTNPFEIANEGVYNIESLNRGTTNDYMAQRKLQGTRKVSTNPFEIANEGVYNIESLNRGTTNDYMAQRKLQGTRKVSTNPFEFANESVYNIDSLNCENLRVNVPYETTMADDESRFNDQQVHV